MAPDDTSQSADAKAQQAKLATDMEQVLKDGLTRVTTSLQTYTDYAIKASKRMIEGDTKADDWAKDAAAISSQWVKDVTGALTGWTEAVNLLAGRTKEGKDPQQAKGGGVSDADPQVALVRLWAQTTADLIDVAQSFWNGLLNLNPAEARTFADACEGSTYVDPQTSPLTLTVSAFVDAHGNQLPNPQVALDPSTVPAGTTSTRVCVSVTPNGHRGRYTAVLLDATGAPASNRFSVYMAG